MSEIGRSVVSRNLELTGLKDNRLVKIDPTSNGFFDNVLNSPYHNPNHPNYNPILDPISHLTFVYDTVQKFIEAVYETVKAGVGAFWKPIYDPSFYNGKVVFQTDSNPAVGKSYYFWKNIAKTMPSVEGRHWMLGTKYQYIAFLCHLINEMVKYGWTYTEAVDAIAFNSKNLGHFWDSPNATHQLERTGSRKFCGFYDLANTYKILEHSEKDRKAAAWIAGGSCIDSNFLADLQYYYSVDFFNTVSVGWLVLQ